MNERGVDAVDAMCDLLLAENLRVNQVTTGPWHETMHHFVVHPVGMFGTDSTFVGAKPSPRTYGSYPRVLGEFVRERRLLGLEEAVRKMTSAPAARLGLSDRGRLADGLMADMVVFDPADGRVQRDLRRAAPLPDRHRLRDRQRHASWLTAAQHTGALPGRVIRR